MSDDENLTTQQRQLLAREVPLRLAGETLDSLGAQSHLEENEPDLLTLATEVIFLSAECERLRSERNGIHDALAVTQKVCVSRAAEIDAFRAALVEACDLAGVGWSVAASMPGFNHGDIRRTEQRIAALRNLAGQRPAFNHTRSDGPLDPCPICLEQMDRASLLALVKHVADELR